jgi:4-aminobutyrate aminotransferase/(S)-3-amino-2-methylpropionate transaminase
MQAFELSTPGTTRPLAGAASMVAEFAAQRGILLLTAGSDGNVIRFLPTLTTTDEQLDVAVDVIDEALSALR